MFGFEVPGEGFTDLEDTEIKGFLHSHTPKSIEDDLEQLTLLNQIIKKILMLLGRGLNCLPVL
jgi:hypothetical protein